MHKYRGEIYLEINACIFPREITLPETLGKPSRNPSVRAHGRTVREREYPEIAEAPVRRRNASTRFCVTRWDEARREAGSRERMDSTATTTTTTTNCAQPVHSPRRRVSRQTAWQLADLFIPRQYTQRYLRASDVAISSAGTISAQGAAGSRPRYFSVRIAFIESCALKRRIMKYCLRQGTDNEK